MDRLVNTDLNYNFFCSWSVDSRDLHSFPTRRSSDLCIEQERRIDAVDLRQPHRIGPGSRGIPRDRKSTRLNSSHQIISYAVFCLQKKKKQSSPIAGITM